VAQKSGTLLYAFIILISLSESGEHLKTRRLKLTTGNNMFIVSVII